MKQKQTIHIGDQQSPYKQNEKETMIDWFDQYLRDPATAIEIDGTTYYRIIAKQEMQSGERKIILCNVDHRIGGKTGDYFIDENGYDFW